MSLSGDRQVLVRSPDDLVEEVQLVLETVEDIGRLVGGELEALDESAVLDDPFIS
jgi:hypothetical protein